MALWYNESTKKTKAKGEPILMNSIIALIEGYVEGLLKAEDEFIGHLDDFTGLEKTVTELSNRMAADFLGMCLTNADELIRMSSARAGNYKVQRRHSRTLISGVGDVMYTHTVYRDGDGHYRCLLDELMHLPDRERFTEMAEAKILSEAEAHSYQHAADSIRSGAQTITKTTVMNKVHAIEQELPETEVPAEDGRKQAEYLYIEADEDHIHRQKDGRNDGCFIGKLVYLFEGKEDVCDGRRKLVAPVYFGGLYSGSEGNAELWKKVDKYIRDHYDHEYLRKVYVSGDGGAWIKSATDHICKSTFIADRFHLMQYIYRAANRTLDDRDETVGRMYRCIHKNDLDGMETILNDIQEHCEGSGKVVEECRKFLVNNWEAIQRAYHDRHVIGCSAEGHVSSVYSERLSSRPMGWSETGSDRMCRLRCFVRNHGRDKIIELVKYRRERECSELIATGTDGIVDKTAKITHYSAEQRNARSYIERMQAALEKTSTVRKSFSIREQIRLI